MKKNVEDFFSVYMEAVQEKITAKGEESPSLSLFLDMMDLLGRYSHLDKINKIIQLDTIAGKNVSALEMEACKESAKMSNDITLMAMDYLSLKEIIDCVPMDLVNDDVTAYLLNHHLDGVTSVVEVAKKVAKPVQEGFKPSATKGSKPRR